MIDLDAFHTLAEVSITFTGLAGIVSVVGGSTLAAEGRQWRVWNMILLSLMAFFACLLPISLDLFSMEPDLLWAVCSTLFIAAQLSQSFFASRAGRRIGRDTSELTIRSLLLVYFVGSFVVGLMQLVNIFVITPGAALYLLGICWFMFLASLHFFVLVMSSDLGSGKSAN